MRCLIVDDDPGPRTLMEKLIRAAGHRATAVESYQEAAAALATESFDVALVDLEMPPPSGADLIARLRRLAPALRVLVVSGYGDRRHVLEALDAGADGYLLKDELGEALSGSLQEVRAGNTPLSPRVASVLLRQLRTRGLSVGRLPPRS